MADTRFDWDEFKRLVPPSGAAPAGSAPSPAPSRPSPAQPSPTPSPEAPPASLWQELRRVHPPANPAPVAAPPEAAPGRGLMGRIYDTFTGNGRTEFPDMPEYTDAPTEPGAARALTGAGYMFARDPAQMQAVFERQYPGSSFSADRYGNPIVTLPNGGGTFYVNKPGASTADFLGLGAPVLEGLAALRGGRMGTSLGGRMAGAAAGGAAGSVAADAGATAVGGTPEIVDAGKNAAIAAAGGAGGEAVTALIGRGVQAYRALRSRGALVDGSTVTPLGQDVIRQSGIDPATVAPDQMQAILREIERSGAANLNPAIRSAPSPAAVETAVEGVAPRVRGARADEFDIPLTRGQRLDDPSRLRTEDDLRFGRRPGGEAVPSFDGRQREAVERAGVRLQAGLGNNQTGVPLTEADTGNRIAAGIRDLRVARQAADDAAYARVGGLPSANGATGGRQIVFDAQAVPDMEARFANIAQGNYTENLPRYREAMADVRRLINADGGAPLGSLEAARIRIGAAISGSTEPAERRALTQLKSNLDEWMDEAINNGHFVGDRTAITRLQAARQSRRETATLFEPENVSQTVPRLIRDVEENGLTGHDLYRRVFGENQPPAGSLAAVQHFERMFGPNHPVMDSLRESRIDWMLNGARANGKPATYELMSQRLSAALDPRGGNQYEITASLFTPEQRAQLTRARDLLRDLARQTRPQNPSGTGAAVLGAVTDAISAAAGGNIGAALGGPVGAVAGAAAGRAGPRWFGTIRGGMAAREAIQPGMPTASRPVSELLRGGAQAVTQELAPPGFAGMARGLGLGSEDEDR